MKHSCGGRRGWGPGWSKADIRRVEKLLDAVKEHYRSSQVGLGDELATCKGFAEFIADRDRRGPEAALEWLEQEVALLSPPHG